MTATITPMTVDTLAVAQRLTGAGMPTKQAEAVAGSLRDVAALDRTDLLDRFATREDLLEANAAMKEDLLEVKQELLAAHAATEARVTATEVKLLEANAATEARVATVEVKLVEVKNELIRWTIGTMVAVGGFVAAIVGIF